MAQDSRPGSVAFSLRDPKTMTRIQVDWLLALAMLAPPSGSDPVDGPSWQVEHDAGWEALDARHFAEAEKHLRTAFELVKPLAGRDTRAATSCDDLAYLYLKQGRAATAQPLATTAVTIWEKTQAT